MRRKAARYVLLSQLAFVLMVVVCGVMNPDVILSNTALSVYGAYYPTFIPFVIGMFAMAGLLSVAIRALPKKPHIDKVLARFLTAIAIMTVLIAIIPLSYNSYFYTTHITIALILVVVNLTMAVWLLSKIRRGILNYALFGGMVVGAGIAVLSMTVFSVFHALATGQIIAVLSFAILLARAVAQLEHVDIEELISE